MRNGLCTLPLLEYDNVFELLLNKLFDPRIKLNESGRLYDTFEKSVIYFRYLEKDMSLSGTEEKEVFKDIIEFSFMEDDTLIICNIRNRIMNFEELFDNLDLELKNLSIRLTKNVYHSEVNNRLEIFINDFKELIHDTQFNLILEQVVGLASYTELLDKTAENSKDYATYTIEKFYVEFIESIKDELY